MTVPMCGISGFVSPITAEEGSRHLRLMLSQISYRGPDECTGAIGDGFGLGVARLTIVDLITGSQPAVSEDGKVIVVFNGEIFNFRELRASLIAKNYKFRTNSEVEVLLKLYLDSGISMVGKLNGQFAIAIRDSRDGTLHLLRDPFGIRPIFWWENGQTIVFGSETKAIFAFPGVSLSLDRKALLQTMRFWTVAGSRSAFSEIRQVPPGHALSWRNGKTKLSRYWYWPFSETVSPLKLDSDEEYFEAFRAAFGEAVERQTFADVEVGSYVSGGIDSTVIIHHLCQIPNRANVSTFSLSFDDPAFDESDAQKFVVDHYRTTHSMVRISAADIANGISASVRHAETPFFRSAPVPMNLLSKRVREAGIKVVMTGEGADEILLGYDLFRETAIRRFWARNPDSKCRGHLLRRLYGYLPQYRNPRYINLLLDFYRPTLKDVDDSHYAMAVRWNNGRALELSLSEELSDLADRYDPVADLNDWLPKGFANADAIERGQAVEVMTLLSNYLLSSQGDRMALANSVETRYPYLDLEFVQFAARLPRNLKLRGLKDKFILRNAYAGAIPDAIRIRQKFAYQAPDKQAFFNAGKVDEAVADILSKDRIRDDGLFDPEAVAKYCLSPPLRESGRQGIRANMLFMLVLTTTLLTEHFIRSRAPKTIPLTFRCHLITV